MLRKSPDNVKQAPASDTTRVPPGQFVTEKFPVLTYGPTPKVDIASWQLRLFGEVEQEAVLDWPAFLQLPWSKIDGDFHCVTQWSALDNTWEGVAFAEIAKLVALKPSAKHVMAHCSGGYTTNVPLDLLMHPGCMLAHKHNGEELSLDHGWPVRLLVPMRYGWKSAKWLKRSGTDGRGPARVLGRARLPQRWRPLEAGALLARAHRLGRQTARGLHGHFSLDDGEHWPRRRYPILDVLQQPAL